MPRVGATVTGLVRNVAFKLLSKRYGQGNQLGYQTHFRYPWKMMFGSRVSINRGSKFYPSFHDKDAFIIVGNNVAIGPEVSVFSAGHDYHHLHLPDNGATVKIGDNVRIGGRAIIVSGVEIGEGEWSPAILRQCDKIADSDSRIGATTVTA